MCTAGWNGLSDVRDECLVWDTCRIRTLDCHGCGDGGVSVFESIRGALVLLVLSAEKGGVTMPRGCRCAKHGTCVVCQRADGSAGDPVALAQLRQRYAACVETMQLTSAYRRAWPRAWTLQLGQLWVRAYGRLPRYAELGVEGCLPSVDAIIRLWGSMRDWYAQIAGPTLDVVALPEPLPAEPGPNWRHPRACLRCGRLFLPAYRHNVVCRRCQAAPPRDTGDWMTGAPVIEGARW